MRMSWWHDPDHFDWLSFYLRQRCLAHLTRAVVAITALSLGAIPVAMLFSSEPPTGPIKTAMALFAGVGGLANGLLWILRFPTRSESLSFAILSSLSITAAAVAQGNGFVALLACTSFATISGYIALFHTGRLVIVNLSFALTVAVIEAIALVDSSGAMLAGCAFAVVAVVNLVVPFGVQIIVHALGVDLLTADRDPLTGLYNRRAFHQHTAKLVEGGCADGHLLVAMIDLDRFKQLNDAQGHVVGDLALAAVGRALREQVGSGTVAARAGGEEFLVADISANPRPDLIGQRLCEVIADLPFPITASVGTATIRRDRLLHSGDPDALIGALIGHADAAMYVAKRNGGNQTRDHSAHPDGRNLGVNSRLRDPDTV